MASGVNKVILIGRLGQNPEVRYTTNGGAVANFTMATNESWVDKSGQKQERTEWHRIVVWGKMAEICGQYLSKGREAYIEGKLQTREWNDKEGNKRYTTEVVAQNVQFLGGRTGAGAGGERSMDSGGMSMGGGGDFGGPGPSDFESGGHGGGGAGAHNFGGGNDSHKGMSDDEVPF